MSQDNDLRSSFLYHLLAQATRPSTTTDALLAFVLERALAITGSDVGGGIFVFDPSGQDRTLLASALRGKLARTSVGLLKAWAQDPRCPAFVVLETGKPYAIPDHEGDSAHFALLADSASSLWVPLLDEGKVIGILHVESSQPGHYRQVYLNQLQELAAKTVPALHRLLLRERMARAGVAVDIVGMSPPFLELERQIRRVAAHSGAPVLITGERGSGKELAAWAIHCWSERWDKPFVPVLASAFAEPLVLDELFGHERHAFTGAAAERHGKFQSAEGGTLFLDEVGDLAPEVQSALLRVVERGEVQRIGRDLPLRVDVRVLAATNRNLFEAIAQGRFREDLYDRLSVFEIHVPPLRERREDIPLLARHFLRKYCEQTRRDGLGGGVCETCHGLEAAGCATSAFYQALQSYDWPGNVRQLENMILRLLALVPDEVLDVSHLRQHYPAMSAGAAASERQDLRLETVIRNHIERVLRMTGFNQSQAARILGLPLSTLRSKMKKLGIEVKES